MKNLILVLLFTLNIFASGLDWSNDYDESVEKAQEENKGLYVLITSDYCKWCRKFESDTLKDKNILKKLNENYILVHLSRNRDDIPVSLKTTPVPIHHFLKNNEKIVYTTVGYRDVETFDYFIDEANVKFKK